MSRSKKIIIMAGPNGAGKTTFARAFLPAEAQLPRFINADLIAAGLSPFAPEAVAVKAGRLMLEEIADAVRRGESFALETTLSGLSYLRHIRQWQALGYEVSLFFLGLPEVELAIARVAERVRQGGHNIPEPVIRRRFLAGRRNFEQHFREAVDGWSLYGNAGGQPVLLDWGERSTSAVAFRDISQAGNPDLRAAPAAMQRAAESAKQLAIQTGTAVVVIKDGQLVRMAAEQLSGECKGPTHMP